MFFSQAILLSGDDKDGALAKIWLASHMEKKLTKSQLLSINIVESTSKMTSGEVPPMALRLSGQLLLGVVRIYSRKAKYLLEECTDANMKLKLSFRPGSIDLPADQHFANPSSITIPDAITEFSIVMPDPDYNLRHWEMESHGLHATFSKTKDITIAGFGGGDTGFGSEGYQAFDLPDDEPNLPIGLDFGLLVPDSADSYEAGRLTGEMQGLQLSTNQGDFNKSNKSPLFDSNTDLNITPGGFGSSLNHDFSIPDISGAPNQELDEQLRSASTGDLDFLLHSRNMKNSLLRKRKNLVDLVTSYSNQEFQNSINDTTDITITDTGFEDSSLHQSKKHLTSWSTENNELSAFMNTQGPSNLIPELQEVFSRFTIDPFKSTTPMDLNSPINAFSGGDILPDGSNGSDYSSIPFNDQGSVREDYIEQSMLFTGGDNTRNNEGLNDTAEDDIIGNEQLGSIARSTLTAVRLIKENLEERSSHLFTSNLEGPASFDEIVDRDETAKRSTAVNLFYELLVLKTKDYINVEQSAAYQSFDITAKPEFHALDF
ncbi:hypothetical protein K502DRAFT_324186 [Neoconidiobolus thromboides FSU 785]|nr:hypothetical protein K502DRAFT_324186 [Neoconidiobolus thromboides FSU 785]